MSAMCDPRPENKSAFTLFELLLVMGILLILAGLAIGISEGLQRRSARDKAVGQLVLLTQALESYKAYYGDYPWIYADAGSDGSRELYAALIGNRGPTAGFQPNADNSGRFLAGSDPLTSAKGRHFIEISQFQTAHQPIPSGNRPLLSLDQGFAENYLIDPWGAPYIYQYKTIGENPSPQDWQRPGYILMSIGPDGALGPALPANGIFAADYFENESTADNLLSTP